MKFDLKIPQINGRQTTEKELEFHRYLVDKLMVSLFATLYRLTNGSMARSLSRDRADGVDNGFKDYLSLFVNIFMNNMKEVGLEDPVISDILLGILANVPEVEEDQLRFYNAYMHPNEKE